MKKNILKHVLFLFAFLSLQNSFSQNAGLVFFTPGSEPFHVFLNGIKQNSILGNNVKVFALEENIYNVLIVIPYPVFSIINNSVKINPARETVFSVAKNQKGEFELSPKGENPLSFAPSSPNQIMVKFNSTLAPVQSLPSGPTDVLNNGGIRNPNDPGFQGGQGNMGSGNNGLTQTPNYLPGYNGPIGCPVPMSLQEFQSAKTTISLKTFESSKITIAKQIAGANCLLSSQVKEIMILFGFEGTKIEFAKFAYPRTYDKGNFFMVNDAFDFDSSIGELNKFIGK